MMIRGLRGGIWLELKKSPMTERPIGELKAPSKLFLPLRQYKGALPLLCVAEGDRVQAGQPVAKAVEGSSCSLHSPVSGTVSSIAAYDHPLGGRSQMVVIENDGRDTPFLFPSHGTGKETGVIDAVKKAAAVSASGFGLPLWVCLSKMAEKKVKTVVLNAVETEPFLCSSQKLMDESPDRIATGLVSILSCVGAQSAILAVSDDIPHEIVEGMTGNARLLGVALKVAHIPQKYPLYEERYLLQQLVSHGLVNVVPNVASGMSEVPHIGYVCAEDCLNVCRAVEEAKPQTTRVITVAGDAVTNPQNLEVRIGTTVHDVLEHCGLSFDPDRVVLGSPMRGVAITDLGTPITKSVTAVLALKAARGRSAKSICINCGKCVAVCPQGLLPNYIAQRAVGADFGALRDLHIGDCIECGSCAYICPGRMPIVELIKNIKKAAQ